MGDETIGAVEDVLLLPPGIKLPARIDTGAATTSLDAHDIRVRGGIAEFTLSEKHGGHTLRLPIAGARRVRGPSGPRARPVVALTICLGRQKMRIEATLADRSYLEYPLLVGRNVLKRGFLVDVRKKRMDPPDCR